MRKKEWGWVSFRIIVQTDVVVLGTDGDAARGIDKTTDAGDQALLFLFHNMF